MEDQYLRPAQKGGVEFEGGILRRRADQRDRAILDKGQEAVLLRTVEAVDLVHEQQCPLAEPGMVPRLGKDLLRSATPEKTAEIAA
ncbi:hypothetical protein GCM10020258_42320 [Sphingomonas yabuuchiae]